ncbi:hypothetical protein BJ085DRAFT_34629, partial [Dimargaris cristalligena]
MVRIHSFWLALALPATPLSAVSTDFNLKFLMTKKTTATTPTSQSLPVTNSKPKELDYIINGSDEEFRAQLAKLVSPTSSALDTDYSDSSSSSSSSRLDDLAPFLHTVVHSLTIQYMADQLDSLLLLDYNWPQLGSSSPSPTPRSNVLQRIMDFAR